MPVAAGIISTGNTYRLFDDSVQTHHTLPVATYSVQFSQLSGFSLLRTADMSVGTDRVYGEHSKKIDRIMLGYKTSERSLGVLFTGDKGMGKSLSMRMIAERAIADLGLPVIKVERDYPGLAEYLDELGEAVIVFDEFEKVFNLRTEDGNRQDQFLSLFDGVSTVKRMYVISANNISDLSSYFVNRPGRFHYHIRHSYPGANEVREYLMDEVDDIVDSTLNDVVAFTRKEQINYDHLRAIAFELKLGGELKDVIADINIKRMTSPVYAITAMFPGGHVAKEIERLDLFRDDPQTIVLRHPDDTDVHVIIDFSEADYEGDSIILAPGSFTSVVPDYEGKKKANDPAHTPEAITISILGQGKLSYGEV